MLNVIMLSVVLLNVVALFSFHTFQGALKFTQSLYNKTFLSGTSTRRGKLGCFSLQANFALV
jgi:hypothetical protein